MKRYKVVGTQPVLDHQPGEEFTADIPTSQEAFLIQIGGLQILPSRDKDEKTPPKQGPSSSRA